MLWSYACEFIEEQKVICIGHAPAESFVINPPEPGVSNTLENSSYPKSARCFAGCVIYVYEEWVITEWLGHSAQ